MNLERVKDYAWSPSGDRIAILAGSDDIPHVIDVENGEATPLVSGEAFFWARGPLHWSADGVLLMYRQNNNLTVQPADGSGPPTVIVEAYRGTGISAGDYHFRPG